MTAWDLTYAVCGGAAIAWIIGLIVGDLQRLVHWELHHKVTHLRQLDPVRSAWYTCDPPPTVASTRSYSVLGAVVIVLFLIAALVR